MSIVISGFPGIGKSYLYDKLSKSDSITDSDSSQFDKSDFPRNYIEHIKDHIKNKTNYILVSSHDNVREALRKSDIEFILIYPDRSLKDEYIKRYIKRGSSEFFVDMMKENWDKFIDSCENDRTKWKIVLNKDDTLDSALKNVEELQKLKEVLKSI